MDQWRGHGPGPTAHHGDRAVLGARLGAQGVDEETASPAWKHRHSSKGITKAAASRAKKVNSRIGKVAKQRKSGKGKSKKQKAKIKKRFDELFKGKSKAQARQAKQAFLKEMKALYGKSPAVMKQIKKELAAEMRKRGH